MQNLHMSITGSLEGRYILNLAPQIAKAQILTLKDIGDPNCTLGEFEFLLKSIVQANNLGNLILRNNKYESWPEGFMELFVHYLGKLQSLQTFIISHNNFTDINYGDMAKKIMASLEILPLLTEIDFINNSDDNDWSRNDISKINFEHKRVDSNTFKEVSLAEHLLKLVPRLKYIKRFTTVDFIRGRVDVLNDIIKIYDNTRLEDISLSFDCLPDSKEAINKLFSTLSACSEKTLRSLNLFYLSTSNDADELLQEHFYSLPKTCQNLESLTLTGCLKAEVKVELQNEFINYLGELTRLSSLDLSFSELGHWPINVVMELILQLQKIMPRLKTLALSNNDLNDWHPENIADLFRCLNYAYNLKVLNLERNGLFLIEPALMRKLVRQLEEKKGITQLCLYDDSLNSADSIHHPALRKLSSRLYDKTGQKIKKFIGAFSIE